MLENQRWSAVKAQSRQDIEDEFARRTTEHRAKVAQVKARRRHGEANNLAAIALPLDLLAIGDSWFDYPVSDAGFPDTNQDIVAKLQTMGNPAPTILSRAVLGQAMTTVMGLKNQQRYATDIADSTQWLRGKPDAILVSGAGDDMVGDQFIVYLDYLGGKLSTRVQGVIDSIEASYQALFQFRDLHAPETKIFGHCYDYAIPNGKGVLFQGPWLKPSLDFAGYSYSDGLTIVQNAIDDLYKMLNGLASVKTNYFYLVDTRNTLVRNATQPLGWANEIHPYTDGFIALANKFLLALRAEIGGI
jgi:hypothetical protein